MISARGGGGGGWGGAKELKRLVRFLGAVVSQFSMGMVCCTRIAINYGYFIAIRRVFREPFEPSASGLNNFLQPLQMLIQYKNMVDPFNMYLENIN